MRWRTLLALAWRNLWRHRRRTVITASMIALGFALAVASIGIGDGAHNQMIRNAIRLGDGHLTIQPKGYLASPGNHLYLRDGARLREHPVLTAVRGRIAPRIALQVLAATAHNSIGAGLQGVAVAEDPFAAILRDRLVAGRWLEAGDGKGVLIGRKMADKLKAKVGSKVVVMAGGDKGEVESRLGRVRGIFSAGVDALDGFVMLSGLEFARNLLPRGDVPPPPHAVTRLAVFLDDPDDAERLKAALGADSLPANAVALDWQEMMPQLVNFIVLDDVGNYVWLMIILVVVLFGILNTILMSVLERTREFGLVRALGMRPRYLLVLVLIETLLLAVLAIAAGWAIGGLGHLYLAVYGIDLSSFSQQALTTAGAMMDPILKSELSWGRIAMLTTVIFVATLTSGLYPAFRAARISPMAALRT
jgi:ABC-type lipoprotein release transport system permease subunit